MRLHTTWSFEPEEPLLLTERFADVEGTVLLHSGGEFDAAKNSFLCLFPKEKIVLEAGERCWETLQVRLGRFDREAPGIPKWVGYLGYEMGCFGDVDKILPYYKPQTPDCCFYAPSIVIHFEHGARKATLYATEEGNSHINKVFQKVDRNSHTSEKLCLSDSSDTLESYVEKIALIKEAILEGEVYQVNLSQEINLSGKSAPFTHFKKLTSLNPAPFTAYVQCKDFTIVSSSPERFLCRKGEWIETRPIKGTAPRGRSQEEDECNRTALLSSAKERAELLMITDLMRSDVGKIAFPGSVVTKEMWRCETYTNVFHLLSIIEGRVSREKHPIEVIRPLFPGGSITGCPKLRAMEVIAALEQRPRGIYTGSIGYIAANGDFDFNLAIRTLIVHPTSIKIQLGGAVVIDSDPIQEFEETLHKGRTLFKVLGLE